MSQQTLPQITEQEKERVKAIHQLFKTAPSQVTEDARKDLRSINEKAWNIAKEKSLTVEDRCKAHDTIKLIHEVCGMKYDDNWKPKEGKKGSGGGWIATKEQRKQNCEDFISYIGPNVWNSLTPFEIGQILASVWGTIKQ